MRINTKIVINIATCEVLERESFEYPDNLPIAHCCGGGGGGGGGGYGSAAGIAGDLEPGEIAGGGPAGVSLEGPAAAWGGAAVEGISAEPDGGGAAPQVTFSKKGMEIGATIGSILGPGGALVGGVIGGVAESAIAGSGVPGGTDMSGDLTGGNAVSGPEPAERRKRAGLVRAGISAKGEPAKPGALEDVTKPAKKEEEGKARKRPKTILTSPLGLRSRPTVRRATLLGG